jgi:hypothetical protein
LGVREERFAWQVACIHVTDSKVCSMRRLGPSVRFGTRTRISTFCLRVAGRESLCL